LIEEEVVRVVELWERVNHATLFRMNNSTGYFAFTLRSDFDIADYNSMVFLMEEPREDEMMSGAIYFWPHEVMTPLVVDIVNREMERTAMSVTVTRENGEEVTYGPNNPITVEDVVERWEDVREVHMSFSSAAHGRIFQDLLA